MPPRNAKAEQDKAAQRELESAKNNAEKVRAKVAATGDQMKAVLGSPAASLVQPPELLQPAIEKLKMLEVIASKAGLCIANQVKYPLAQKIFDEHKKICTEASKQTAIAKSVVKMYK